MDDRKKSMELPEVAGRESRGERKRKSGDENWKTKIEKRNRNRKEKRKSIRTKIKRNENHKNENQ